MGASGSPGGRLGGVITGTRAVRVMQGIIVLLIGYGLVSRNLSVVVNGVLGLVTTVLPAILKRDYQIALEPPLVLWITVAILLHTIGMTGPYDTVWWWDHLTHTLSATVVAGVGFAVTRAIDEYWEEIYLPPDFMFVFIILFTLAAGVLWEVLEFVGRVTADALGQGPVLIQYDLADSVVDLLFNGLGAVLVAGLGKGRFDRLIDSIERAIERAYDDDRDMKR